MEALWKAATWHQFGAAIDMLENPIVACPDELWDDSSEEPGSQFWYVAHHALSCLDLYLSGSLEGFAPPPPFTPEEVDTAEPARPYTRDELLTYLDYCRRKCRATIEALTEESAARPCTFPWTELRFSFAELLLYNLRHVQEHAAQLSLILGRRTGWETGWVSRPGRPRSAT